MERGAIVPQATHHNINNQNMEERLVLDLRSAEAHELKKHLTDQTLPTFGKTHHSHSSQTQLQALLNDGWRIEHSFRSSYLATATGDKLRFACACMRMRMRMCV